MLEHNFLVEMEQFLDTGNTAFPVMSSDPRAQRELLECDYTKRYSLEEARAGRTERKIRVYCDGCFDLFHYGHMRVLLQAKYLLPNAYLIAGVSTDSQIRECKGVRPIMNRAERLAAVSMMTFVDELCDDPPMLPTLEFCSNYKIDFVAHDAIPYTSCLPPDETYEWAKQAGMFLETKRTESISTSNLIERVVQRSDEIANCRPQKHQ